MTKRVQPLVEVRQIAADAGWKYHRMLRHLQKLDKELGGTLLVREGKGSHIRYSLTLANLERVRQGWVSERGEEDEESELSERVSHVEALLLQTRRALATLVRRVEVVERRLQ